jgi:hypothetical protein
VEVFIQRDDGKFKSGETSDSIKHILFFTFLLDFTVLLQKHGVPVLRPDSDADSRFQHIDSITHAAKVDRFRQKGSKFFTLYSSQSTQFAAFTMIQLLWSA